MEYFFQSGRHEKPVKAILNEFDMVVETSTGTKSIPYASITEVRLGKKKDLYYSQVIALDFGTLLIPNKSVDTSGAWKDQSRIYHTFIRVLHLHLSSKSKASFYTGFNFNEQAIKIMALLMATALLFLSEEYFDWVPLSALILSLLFFALGFILILAPKLSQWPKSYEPTEIPFDLLPPA